MGKGAVGCKSIQLFVLKLKITDSATIFVTFDSKLTVSRIRSITIFEAGSLEVLAPASHADDRRTVRKKRTGKKLSERGCELRMKDNIDKKTENVR